jgi:ADP-ribose pyrophosphatase
LLTGENPMDDLTEHTLSTEQVWCGKLLDVRRDVVRLPDGKEGLREYIVHPGAVVVIPVLPNGKLLFERQHRYPVRRTIIELPAGKIDPGEDIAVCARRELLEETGREADDWRYLGRMHPCVGYADERIEIFLARALRVVAGQQLDHGEFLELVELSINEASAMIRDGAITDGKTITALYWAEKVLSGQWEAGQAA